MVQLFLINALMIQQNLEFDTTIKSIAKLKLTLSVATCTCT
jgi:hypothetical protein